MDNNKLNGWILLLWFFSIGATTYLFAFITGAMILIAIVSAILSRKSKTDYLHNSINWLKELHTKNSNDKNFMYWMLFIYAPYGMYLVWKNNYHMKRKPIIVILSLFWVVMLVSNADTMFDSSTPTHSRDVVEQENDLNDSDTAMGNDNGNEDKDASKEDTSDNSSDDETETIDDDTDDKETSNDDSTGSNTNNENDSTNKPSENNNISSDEPLYVHYIDVGQGDATLIEYGDYHILIDAGNNWYGDDVVNYLNSQGVDDIEILIGTHPDADHIGGLDVVMNNFKVETIIDSCREHDTITYQDYANSIQKQVDNGATWICPLDVKYQINDDIYFEVINTNVRSSDNNDHSVLTKLVAFDKSFLFTGDLEEQVESTILNEAIDVDVYKVGHHGSNTSSSSAFLKEVTPSYAIISCGEDNKYGHPHDEAVLRIQEYTDEIYSTHLSGHIVVSVDENIFSIDAKEKVTTEQQTEDSSTESNTDTSNTNTNTDTGDTTEDKTEEKDTTILTITNQTTSINAGAYAFITVKGSPNTVYDIDVHYKSGVSTSSTLNDKTSDTNGNVRWDWKVGSRTSAGTYKIVISGGGKSITTYFEVYK